MFRVGNKVQWTSAANGSSKTKEGTVMEVVKAGAEPSRNWRQLYRGPGVGMPRDHESYVVLVGKKQYWPRANKLSPL